MNSAASIFEGPDRPYAPSKILAGRPNHAISRTPRPNGPKILIGFADTVRTHLGSFPTKSSTPQ
jgi:hypothetical protein